MLNTGRDNPNGPPTTAHQPVLGLMAGAGVIVVSLAVIALFSWAAFSGWVAYALMSATPSAVIAGTVWSPERPPLAQLTQPVRGLAMLAVAVVIGAASAGLGLLLVGHSVSPPIPSLSQFAVDAIPVAFWLCLIWERWPFACLPSRLATAGALIVACYAVNYGVYELLVGSGWMAGATFDAVSVSAVALMFLMLQFELWPLTRFRAMEHQPTRGAIWTVLVLAGGVGLVLLGTKLWGTPAAVYMARAPIPFIFGCILTLNTFQGSLVARLEQPLRGLSGSLLATGGGLALGVAYRALTPTLTGHLSSVPPTYERATWLASALLGVTFLFLSLHKDFLGFWPLVRETPRDLDARAAAVAPRSALKQS